MNNLLDPDFSKCALLTIDTQCDTLDGQPLEVPGTSAVLPNVVRLLMAFRRKARPIIHIVRIYKRDGSNVDLCRRQDIKNGAQILLEGHPGCELAADLLPGPDVRFDHQRLLAGEPQQLSDNELIIYKPRWGAFFRTPLEALLVSLGVNTLVFCGCNFPNCPRTSIYEASERDFKIVLAEDAVSGLYSQGKKEMMNIGVRVASTSSILKAFEAADYKSTGPSSQNKG